MKKYDEDFKKASFSHGWGKVYKCVEVKRTEQNIKVRDSKAPNDGTLSFTSEEWDAFVKGVKHGEFDV